MRTVQERKLVGPALLTAAGFLAYALAPHLGLDPAATLALRDLVGIGSWLALAWTGGRACDRLLLRATRMSGHPYPRLLSDLLHVALFAAAVVAILLAVFQRDATGLIATSSVTIAVIGFALRGTLADLFAGIALGVEPPYRIGDWIGLSPPGGPDSTGRVTEINWRATRLVTRSGAHILVPNGVIAAQRLTNYSAEPGGYRAVLAVPLDPALPVRRAERVLLAGALDAARLYPDLAPDIRLKEIADGNAVWLVRFMVPDYGREIACRNAVGHGVLRALRRAGLEVARPRREVALARYQPTTPQHGREALLRNVDLFRPFDVAERTELATHMHERVIAPGEAVVREGEAGNSLFVIAEGALEVEHGGLPLERLVAGAVFGEMSLLTGQPRSATVRAGTEAVVYEVDRAHLQPLLERRPDIAEGLAAVMAARQAMNAERQRQADQPPAPPPSREDLLRRLRSFFHLR
jgi:small-conductance mechanosensitive channel/CRP-like cAMP-binding protein